MSVTAYCPQISSQACRCPADFALLGARGSHRDVQPSNRQPELRLVHTESTRDPCTGGGLSRLHRMHPWCVPTDCPVLRPPITLLPSGSLFLCLSCRCLLLLPLPVQATTNPTRVRTDASRAAVASIKQSLAQSTAQSATPVRTRRQARWSAPTALRTTTGHSRIHRPQIASCAVRFGA